MFLFRSVENEVDIWHLVELVVCLVADNETLRDRLEHRTTNAFGKHPDQLAAALSWNDKVATTCQRIGATIIDGTQPPDEVAELVLAAAVKTCL